MLSDLEEYAEYHDPVLHSEWVAAGLPVKVEVLFQDPEWMVVLLPALRLAPVYLPDYFLWTLYNIA